MRGGKGGATGGVGAAEGGGGSALKDGFLEDIGGGGGGFPRLDGRGGGTFGGRTSMEDWVDRSGMSGFGLGGGFRGVLRRFATNWLADCGGDDSVVGSEGLRALSLDAGGGFGADPGGSRGAEVRDDSGSDV